MAHGYKANVEGFGAARQCGNNAAGTCEHVGMPNPVPLALARERIFMYANHAEAMLLQSKANAAGVSVSNYLRSLAGLPPMAMGRPTREDMEKEQDRAWEILKSMGVDPAPLLPEDESWLDAYR